MRVRIVTEGGGNIGLGHIARCDAIYQAFEDIGIPAEFVINGDKSVPDLLKGRKFHVFDWLKEQEKLFGIISGSEVVMIDSYLADISLYKSLAGKVEKAVFLDDNMRIDYPAGIIINGTVFSEEFNYARKAENTYLLGTKYTPLREYFREMPVKSINENISDITVIMGGYDTRELTPKITGMLKQEFPGIRKSIIAGKWCKNIDMIKQSADNMTEVIVDPAADKLKNALLNTDVAITAAGQSLYEFACAGVPAITVMVADNQLNNVRGWKKAGFIEDAGSYRDESLLRKIKAGVQKLSSKFIRTERSRIGQKYVDGKGALRIALYCSGNHFESNLTLRKVSPDDVLNVYELANDSEVRRYSFNTDGIDINAHKKWFSEKLRDTNCVFFIAEIGNKFIGQVRFDIKDSEAVIGISILGKYRGIGSGGVVLGKSIKALKKENPAIRIIKAFVKEENTGSAKLFEGHGFDYMGKLKVSGSDSLEYAYHYPGS